MTVLRRAKQRLRYVQGLRGVEGREHFLEFPSAATSFNPLSPWGEG